MFAALLVAVLWSAPGAIGDHGSEGEPVHYDLSYTLGASAGTMDCIELNGTRACPVFGVATCQESAGVGVGGACPAVTVENGSALRVDLADATGVVSYALCVDGNGNGECRPDLGEQRWDTILFHGCGPSRPMYTNAIKAPGPVYVFVMEEVTADGVVCAPTTGRGDLTVWPVALPECMDGQDNDGDGWIDHPLDPDCTDLHDDSERPPPPVVTH